MMVEEKETVEAFAERLLDECVFTRPGAAELRDNAVTLDAGHASQMIRDFMARHGLRVERMVVTGGVGIQIGGRDE